MSPEEKSVQYSDLNANKRLLEIQAEIVAIEKRRIYEHESLLEQEKNEMKERIKYLVSEEKMILQTRYAKQKDIKSAEGENQGYQSENGLNKIIENEIAEDKKIEGELKEIIDATKDRMWYEKWWGKLIIIMLGAIIISLLSGERSINLYNLLG